ncbi:MAG TPA: HD domain-containing protein [Candidatus Paceibacterota bacterium]
MKNDGFLLIFKKALTRKRGEAVAHEILNHELVRKAADFAKKSHAGQLRKNGKEYFSHADAVARIVAAWSNEPETVAAAFLHDTLEKCCITLGDITGEFGPRVARYVSNLSKRTTAGLAIRFVAYCAALRKAPEAVKLIKAADIVHNASDDPKKGWFPQAGKMMAAVQSGKLGNYSAGISALGKEFRRLAAPILDRKSSAS